MGLRKMNEQRITPANLLEQEHQQLDTDLAALAEGWVCADFIE